ncbi:hypothetical protein ACET3Z_009025 [Daucus carota]
MKYNIPTVLLQWRTASYIELSESQDLRQLSLEFATLTRGDVEVEQSQFLSPGSLDVKVPTLEPDLRSCTLWQSGLRKSKYFKNICFDDLRHFFNDELRVLLPESETECNFLRKRKRKHKMELDHQKHHVHLPSLGLQKQAL